jgi:(2R)-3-sulfolactate dehydrogenase (NADP+)
MGPSFAERMEKLFETILSQEGVRLPGSRRLEARERTATEGVTIRKALHEKLLGYCNG